MKLLASNVIENFSIILLHEIEIYRIDSRFSSNTEIVGVLDLVAQ